MEKTSVLIVDDEPALRNALRISLAAAGFAVEEARNGAEAVEMVEEQQFDLVLLDMNMPGTNGMTACRGIRKIAPQTGIVMVTVKDLEEDKIKALEAGADDYITKPFRLRELIARLRAILRRTRVQDLTDVLQVETLKLDLQQHRFWRGEEEIHLSPKEFDLLAFMMKHSGALLTHVNLLRSVWGPEYGGEMEYLRSYVRMLRKKIETDPANPRYIMTEPWVGYRFRNPSDSDAPAPLPERD
jgi:two-component system KDP operon response regulator KdpE